MSAHKFQNPFAFVKRFLSDNPELVKAYVNAGIATTRLAIVPINSLLKHLIIVQDRDPNVEPDARNRQLFINALNQSLSKNHKKSYDDSFDFSWVKKQFKEHEVQMKELDVSEDDFEKLTNLNSLDDISTLPVTPPMGPTISYVVESEVPLTIDRSPVDELEILFKNEEPVNSNPVNKDVREVIDKAFTLEGTVNSPELKRALKKIVELARSLEDKEENIEDKEENLDSKALFARTEYLKGVREDIKNYGTSTIKPRRGGDRVRRSINSRTDVIKSSKKSLGKRPVSFRRSNKEKE